MRLRRLASNLANHTNHDAGKLRSARASGSRYPGPMAEVTDRLELLRQKLSHVKEYL